MKTRTVVLRLVGGRYEGMWWAIPDHVDNPLLYNEDTPMARITMVATGCVEWDGDRCAEVYVPESRLAEWRAEHDVEV